MSPPSLYSVSSLPLLAVGPSLREALLGTDCSELGEEQEAPDGSVRVAAVRHVLAGLPRLPGQAWGGLLLQRHGGGEEGKEEQGEQEQGRAGEGEHAGAAEAVGRLERRDARSLFKDTPVGSAGFLGARMEWCPGKLGRLQEDYWQVILHFEA